jgi:CheY-like chemotaxis protein
MAETAKIQLGSETIELPIIIGSEGERAIDISRLRAETGYITLDPGYANTGSCKSAITFINGEEGIRTAKELGPDLVLLDIMMPGIDGWETLTRLKRDPATAKIPVIIFTAREHSRGHQKSEEMGAADYFRKPFEPDELIELVEKHVGQKV